MNKRRKRLLFQKTSSSSEERKVKFLENMSSLLVDFDTCYFNATDEDTPDTLLNMANANYNLTKFGAVTHVKNKGYKGNGSDAYLRTGWNAQSAGNNHIVGDRSYGVYISDKGTSGYAAGTYLGNSGNSMTIHKQTGFFRVNLNSNISSGIEEVGLYIGVEIAGTYKIYFDGAEVYSGPVANNNINSREFFYLCLSHTSPFGFFDGTIGGGFTGRGLTPEEVVKTNKEFKKLIN